jgi:hypothetical protein
VLENVNNKRVLDQFVKFLYTDTLEADDDTNEPLILLADKYAIGSLKSEFNLICCLTII